MQTLQTILQFISGPVGLVYIIGVNVLAFFYIGLDKLFAQLHFRRISERMLWFVSIIGGSLGTLIGMAFFHHKTRKTSFQVRFAVILAIQIFIIFIFVL